MPEPVELQRVAEEALDACMALHPVSQRPTLQWRKLRVSAGIAHYRENLIKLSTLVLDDEEKVRSTVIHEYAHLLAFHRHGTKGAGHGRPWQIAMRDLGVEPTVRHQYPVHRNESRQSVHYRCLKCGKVFVRKKKFPRWRIYLHVSCGGRLRLHRVEKETGRSFLS